MVINVINLSPDIPGRSMNPHWTPELIKRSREERLLSICQQSKEHGFAFRCWEGIIDPRGGFAGINRSFKKIVQWAKDNNEPMVCIAEDDMVFSAPGAWQYYLDQMPETFDTYLGGIYSGQVTGNRIMNGYSGNTLITISKTFYEFFLALTEDDHLDRRLGNHCFEKQYLLCQPYCVFQLSGYSDNQRRSTSHEAFMDKVKLFGRD